MAQPRPASASRLRTTFRVPAIHCGSCVSYIDHFILSLRPAPMAVATSGAAQTVTVEHDASLKASMIAWALGTAGYDVDSIVSDRVLEGEKASLASEAETEAEAEAEAGPSRARAAAGGGGFGSGSSLGWPARVAQGWRQGRRAAGEESRRRRHVEHCEQCRAEQGRTKEGLPGTGTSITPSSGNSVNEKSPGPFVVIDSAQQPDRVFSAVLSISGMTCSSCVGQITRALEEKAWVKSASVSLLTHSATVEVYGEGNAQRLVEIIEDVGYDASLERVEEQTRAAERPGPGPDAMEDVWKANYSVEGMTCSSCVGAITTALKPLSWVRKVDVNLITNSATVVFEDKKHLEEIATAIEDVGYDAQLNSVDAAREQPRQKRRTVSLHVDGMYCQHCPPKISSALAALGDEEDVTIDKQPTVDDPILTISYTPRSPGFTIRTILSTISAADTAFTPTMHHPPTMEERTHQLQARARRRITYRVLLSATLAIPSFIIGIVYMSLVPSTNPGRHYLTQLLRGVPRAEWALFVLATPVYFFAADAFHRGTLHELRALWRPGSSVPVLRRLYRFGSMNMLVSLGTSIAYFSSVVQIALAAAQTGTGTTAMGSGGPTTYFDSVVFLTMFLLGGRWIEAYSKAKMGEAVTMLGKLRPETALLVLPIPPRTTSGMTGAPSASEGEGGVQSVQVDMVDVGDVVRVVHGASPPWDGTLVSLAGTGAFDESSLTGESRPVKKAVGDAVYSGTINEGGPVSVRITSAEGESMLDQIIKVVQGGQARRAPVERLADVLTGYFVPVVTLIAIATWLVWLGLGLSGVLPRDYLDVEVGGWPFWSLQFAIAVFVVACPCGIGLAAPTALFVGGGLAAKHGILAKGGGEAFQEASGIDVVVFDKTGTLTEGGEPKVTDHRFLPAVPGEVSGDRAWTESTVLTVVRELEGNSSHPIGKAMAAFCRSKEASPPAASAKAEHVEETKGKGLQGSFTIGSLTVEILVGNETLMADHAVALDSTTQSTLEGWKRQAKSIVLVAGRFATPPLGRRAPTAEVEADVDAAWEPLAIFAVADQLRPESRAVVDALRRQGIDVWMISGDNTTTAVAVAAQVGIPSTNVLAGVLPDQKADKIKYLQQSQPPKRSSSYSYSYSSVRTFFGSRGTDGAATSTAKRTPRAMVAMVGDGVNDAPALTLADVGIAMGSGSDVALSAADFVLLHPRLTSLLTLLRLSRAVFRRVRLNFAWALVYNLLALPVAAGVLYPLVSRGAHVRLDPVWASLAMALSSVSVVFSSLLLRSGLPVVGFREGAEGAEGL